MKIVCLNVCYVKKKQVVYNVKKITNTDYMMHKIKMFKNAQKIVKPMMVNFF